jgi:phosphodiesterase/alkaline phosphatase D-like protein
MNETAVRAAPADVTSTTQYLAAPLKSSSLKLAFGSCYGLLEYSTDIFKYISRDYAPDLWIWLGDAAYTDDIMGFCK